MVFNWFRRQKSNPSAASGEETPSPTPQAEQEEKVTEQPAEEQSQTVADDYLSWAKTAYKNIQKQQSSPEVQPTATEPTEIPAVEESQAEESEAPAATTTTEPEAVPIPEASESPELLVLTETTEVATEEEAVLVEPALTQSEAETTAVEPADPELTEEAPITSEPEAVTPEAPIEPAVATETAAPEAPIEAPVATETAAPEAPIEAPVATETAAPEAPIEPAVSEEPTAPVPIWARQADREERLKRLEATAIETPEPEPIKVAAQLEESVAEAGVGGVAFDEEFVWSAQVLAAQGRTPEDVSVEEISWLKRLRQGLGKTRRSLINQLKAIVGQGPLNQDAVMEIEALLLQADVGVDATDYIISTLQAKLREEVLPPEQAIAYLKKILRDLLDKPYTESYSTTFVPEKDTLNIWLMTGVNGVGKTTTIGKIAHLANKSDYRCLIGAADTFRAAAVEQVKVWGERSGTEVIANPGKNTDPAAVVFDAITAAQARNAELLLVDTAGRLQNKKNLMEELAKIRRIIDKKAPDAKVESLLVLDATLGQNGLRQAEVFSEAAKLSGVVLTKLDGTAKGGVALAVVQQLGLPIRFIGAGEGIEDLRPFSSYEFVEALLSG
ncbi:MULTISPECIES: signal recognition particle-docking protein FtsY [unclassified Coleofasciculus]|uniref:signal recognition particle-docking protein FtsY n=1 Tax=unclassified Coleofasciculus TaxID=2692782 RepID=UPI00187E650A|nr:MULTISPECIES: signal recognition particle-docking protein FtsY [unclassified Coleofasciculus]MBE9128914.1 signal recognition particle-docking protein FtsY [Coleofasciculus sp. LEGE 07081]MBE9151652.1 signal recognition particle-docking protein FtsY [Coleofasciculus sp. LEGE 07092]